MRLSLRNWLTSWASEIQEIAGLVTRVRDLSRSVLLATELVVDFTKMSPELKMTLERMLISGDEILCVTGTRKEIEAAAVRMSRRTKQCVVVAVVVAHYHRRNCDEAPRGGFTEVGN